MRVVVLGPYPPTPDPQGDDVLALVRRLRAEGATVTVVSTVPSAAPHHGDPSTWWGAARAARVVRGADRVVWFGPHRRAAPLRRALAAVPRVEHRPGGAAPGSAPSTRAARLSRVRAGAPTFVRTVAGRLGPRG